MSAHDKLHPARLLANAARARRQAREASPGSYAQAWATNERRLWLILAKQQIAQRKGKSH